jgi:hypothetical protein
VENDSNIIDCCVCFICLGEGHKVQERTFFRFKEVQKPWVEALSSFPPFDGDPNRGVCVKHTRGRVCWMIRNRRGELDTAIMRDRAEGDGVCVEGGVLCK